MSTPDQARLAAAADVVEIGQLVLIEREAISRAWWRQAGDCYGRDAEIRVPGFRGPVEGYLEHRRDATARGRRVRWTLSAPVVHLNEERAVAVTGAVVSVLDDLAGFRARLGATLVHRVHRPGRAWFVVGIDCFLREASVTEVPAAPTPPIARLAEAGLMSGEALRALGEVVVEGAADAESRYGELLAWAGLAPGIEAVPPGG